MFDLTGRTALITGAGQNVGAAIAATLAAQGAAVAVNDLFADRADAVATAITADGEAHRPRRRRRRPRGRPRDRRRRHRGDQPDGRPRQQRRRPAEPRLGHGPVPAADPRPGPASIDVDLYGVFNCAHAIAGGMAERGWGRVVNIVSDGGRIGEANMAVYCRGQGGSVGSARRWRRSWRPGRHGQLRRARRHGPAQRRPRAEWPTRRAATPVGRIGEPGDIAPAVLYLASDEAEWVTGQVLPVNGGYAAA